ncbi:MAG: hypothetical protein C0404_06115 [Verrucomicrobia bacterium]|nr:hypothetical protein [Verrucomicrobiota bacterium]
MSLAPHPSSLPPEKLAGRTAIEYEKGVFSYQGPNVMDDMGYDGNVLPALGGQSVADIQPVIVNRKMYFCNSASAMYQGVNSSSLHYIYTDGSSDVTGMAGVKFIKDWDVDHMWPRFAASPDGKWLYMLGLSGPNVTQPVVLRIPAEGGGSPERFAGDMSAKGRKITCNPGSDNDHFNSPQGIDCDAQGRVYVADCYNNRIQIFSPEGKYLKTIPADGVHIVRVHQKTGAIYVQNKGTVQGRSVPRVTKFTSFDNPKEEYSADGYENCAMVVDSWAPVTRIWVGGGLHRGGSWITALYENRGSGVIMLEDDGKSLKKLVSFDEEWQKAAGAAKALGHWSASVFDHVYCDPNREQLYFGAFRGPAHVFDLKTGNYQKTIHFQAPLNDISFCKRGYMHCHIDPGFGIPGVGRIDPGQQFTHRAVAQPAREMYREVPYNYGVPSDQPHAWNWMGLIPVKDQPGAKYFQDGFGVNMKGDIAVESNIYYVPKMEEEGWGFADAGHVLMREKGQCTGPSGYSDFLKQVQERQKRGEEVYSIPRQPGVALAGSTVWRYDAQGELQTALAVQAGGVMGGVQMDEDGNVYFVSIMTRMFGDKSFLYNRGTTAGSKEGINRYNAHPCTGTLFKTKDRNVRFLKKKAAVPLEPVPQRPTDVVGCGPFGPPYIGSGEEWVEGVDWMYAGVSPAVPSGCTCPSVRLHLDWFKRTYVPEQYRHSIGILDTNGNLIMHLGRYGNHDDVLRAKPGSEDIGLTGPRFISGTDNYLAFDDWGERIVTMKLNYHAEESTMIAPQ